MRWAFPEYGWWLLLIPGVLILLSFIMRRAWGSLRIWFRKEDFRFHFPGLRFALRSLGVACLGIALTGPYWGRREQNVNVLGREVYFVVDVSASMTAEDLKPSRLDKVKQELKKVVGLLKGDKMGLIVFTSNAYVQTPLTTDFSVLNMFIDLVNADQFSYTGTDFRAGLNAALERFTHAEKSNAKTSRAIVLISDGENFGDSYKSVLERLKEQNIRVYCVGAGTYEGAPVPEMQYGKKTGYKKNADGGTAVTKLNDESLKAIAAESGTEYVALQNQVDDLKPVAEQVLLQSAAILDSRTEQINNNRYQFFLAPGLLLLFLSLFLMPQSVSPGKETEEVRFS